MQSIVQAHLGNRQCCPGCQGFEKIHFRVLILAGLTIEGVQDTENIALQQQRHTGVRPQVGGRGAERVFANDWNDQGLLMFNDPAGCQLLQGLRELAGGDDGLRGTGIPENHAGAGGRQEFGYRADDPVQRWLQFVGLVDGEFNLCECGLAPVLLFEQSFLSGQSGFGCPPGGDLNVQIKKDAGQDDEADQATQHEDRHGGMCFDF